MEEIKINAILNHIKSLKELKKLNILKNKKDFNSQLGEWIISILYNGEIAKNGKQKDWDLLIDNKKAQVKCHSKAITSLRKDTDFKYTEIAEIDIFFIIIFDEYYNLETIYKIPFKEALKLKTKTKYPVIRWNDIDEKYSVDLKKEFLQKKILMNFLKD